MVGARSPACGRAWPADLHLHTVFSDGKIHSLDFLAGHGVAVAALTDHNTVAQHAFFAQKQTGCRLVPGMELSLTGCPDTLFYFSDARELPAIENYLASVRAGETEITRQAYIALGFDNWEADLAQCLATTEAPQHTGDTAPVATTRHLAAIIRQRRATGAHARFVPDAAAWKEAREARLALGLALTQGHTGHAGTDSHKDGQFFSKAHIDALLGFKARMVLPHPIYSACRLARRASATPGAGDVLALLEAMLAQFRALGGVAIEWEYIDAHFRKAPPLPPAGMQAVRDFLLEYARKHDLWLSIGSDAHAAGDYKHAFAWLQAQRAVIGELCAPFLSALCA